MLGDHGHVHRRGLTPGGVSPARGAGGHRILSGMDHDQEQHVLLITVTASPGDRSALRLMSVLRSMLSHPQYHKLKPVFTIERFPVPPRMPGDG